MRTLCIYSVLFSALYAKVLIIYCFTCKFLPAQAKGAKVKVSFKTAAGKCRDDAWIGVVPTSVEHGKAFKPFKDSQSGTMSKTFKNKTEGEVELQAPHELGKFDFRMFLGETTNSALYGYRAETLLLDVLGFPVLGFPFAVVILYWVSARLKPFK